MTKYTLPLTEGEIARYRMMAQLARNSEERSWALAGVRPGALVADIGCGPGAVTLLLAEAVGPAGSVVGVDASVDTIATARHLAAGIPNVEFRVGAADDTGLPEGSFDVVMLRHVLAHNGGREQAIVDHLAQLVRPGGVVYLVDVDLSAIRLYPSLPEADELLSRYVQFHRSQGNNPLVGLELQKLLSTAALDVLEFTGQYNIVSVPPGLRPPPWVAREAMVAAGVASQDDIQRWAAALDELDAATERPLLFASMFVGLGRRAEPVAD